MTPDDIIRMAREAGSIDSEEVIETVWRAFSAAEREACAKVCERQVEDFKASLASVNHMEASTKRFVIEFVEIFSSQCAAAIKAEDA